MRPPTTPRSGRTVRTAVLFLVAATFVASGERTLALDPVDFDRDIRRILSDNCFACHGPDKAERQAELRLDQEASAKATAIVPGSPDKSEVIARIRSDDIFTKMPPVDSGKSLSTEEIALIERWIAEGANYSPHWSFVPPERPAMPTPKNKSWGRNSIDAFVLARLEKEGLEPSPPADRSTLIRRVSLDLTGLPPTPGEVETFLKDTRPGAYKRLVDRLLASPRFGERMARKWLDIARYADTMGYQADWERYQWRWRTWVIDAYNRNLPFDQFTIEQLAGDLLPNPTIKQLIATGFNRNHRINDEGGIIPEEYQVEYVVDRVSTTSSAWMGLTMGCARCHDHKFDPISQVDFYKFYAYFNAIPEEGKAGREGYAKPYLRVAVRGMQPEYEALKNRLATAEKNWKNTLKELKPQRTQWIAQTTARLDAIERHWAAFKPNTVASTGGVTFKKLADGSYLATGKNADSPVYTVRGVPGARRVTGIRLEALTHKSLSKGKLSRGNGNFVLSEFEIAVKRAADENSEPTAIIVASADYEQDAWPIENAFDGKSNTGWAVDGHRKPRNRTAIFRLSEPLELAADDELIITLRHESEHARHAIGRFRVSLTNRENPESGNPLDLPDDLVAILRTEADKRDAKQKVRLAEYHATTVPSAKPARNERADAQRALKQFEKANTTYVMVMKMMENPRETHLLERGSYDAPGKLVTKGVPADLLGRLPPDAPNNRLGLAKWLVSGKHPLTGRVAVNRYWAMMFGAGLVRTPGDFGYQGEFPTHPALLDWLATEYVRQDWNTKAMLRLMVTSATYRQSSVFPEHLRERDPENRLLARASRWRLPAEMIRDQALAASGLLVEYIGGASVKPYQPKGLWAELSFQSKSRTTDYYVQDTGSKLYRRSLYTFWKRSVPPPGMTTFDAPGRNACTLSRSRTNTPLQALALMNDVTYIEASRVLAEQALLSAEETWAARIEFAFRRLLARSPDPFEAEILRESFGKRLSHFQQHRHAAQKLITAGDSKANASLNEAELAALTAVVMNILNLDETIHRE